MSLSYGYLTPKQTKIWDMKKKGFLEANIARELNVTRQTVHKAVEVANSKVSQALIEMAKLSRIKVEYLNPTKGILIGYSQEFGTQAIITFSASNNIQIWYRHRGNCEQCDQVESCQKKLLAELEDRNIQPPKNLNSIPPSELAEFLFQKIIKG
ncbi:MAG: hypothetical protein ACPLYF_05365 [Fervidobacterium sp.]